MHKMADLLSSPQALFKIADGFLSLDGLVRATYYHSSKITNLIDGTSSPFILDSLTCELEQIEVLNSFERPFVVLAYYELGELFELAQVPKDAPLCLVLEFTSSSRITFDHQEPKNYSLEEVSNLSREDYQEMFARVQGHLLDGDCYQLNLTHGFKYQIRGDLNSLIRRFLSNRNLSAYAHLINIPMLNLLVVSNSPECLFSIRLGELFSMPIKGTKTIAQGIEALRTSVKDESELNIVTDLLRNDLSRIGENFSRVVSKKSFLSVPGLIHQYSKIKVALDEKLTLLQLLRAIFPGGSITGAPKKRVVKLIEGIEKDKRGLYTGSTILLCGEIREASINIRTAVINTADLSLSYGAGGGITIKSTCEEEYEEVFSKIKSFFSNIL